ncbi:ABC transporter ATP-binding protein [Vibrio fluvialis]|uniref:ABC transporter ATP-binding protein n=1 Tax=Vibrio fluvialis TaxID=676 RepID=UPI001C9C14D6|nr:ABC transporter ATP-binding protein [Vibrio fluvialis]ELS8949563.1 ABC transporter ATP-binding protein [Vibrio fluvialis]ELV8726417.1 ABC transporter ATP-binding protein [Vibrio fluvialis]MBY8022944.1 ABC transporter ATP-binding protein [Vibrio fluvialis]MBY8279495.1 ABC transporter ATP-binding protein [Vibrio fluvialis]MCG6359607.1 ABC transporter ATP-binding protein [Vibrio fluvialis]
MFTLSGVEMVRGGRRILAIEQLNIPTNELTVVLGHNGSGKSTLVSLLSGQQAPDTGSVWLNDAPLTSLSSKSLAKAVAFLPQKLPASAGLTVRELVRLGRFPWRGALGFWRQQDADIIRAAMDKTGVSAFADTFVDELSGGERQRAWVAMLLAQESPVLILDEPTSALDVQHQYQLMALLAELNQKQGCGIIVILHDLNLALRYATHIVALKQGRIAFDGPATTLADEQRLSDLYQTPITLIAHPHAVSEATTNKVAIVCA